MTELLPDSMSVQARRAQIMVPLLLVTTVIIYSPALMCGYIWDDHDYVTDNPTLRTSAGLLRIWTDTAATPQYYPLVHTTYWLEYRLWRLQPCGYHLTNVLLHGLSAVLLWKILIKLSVPGAWLAALIFVVHPVNVESVAWITERKNVLSGTFYLGAMLAYLRFQFPNQQPDSADGTVRHWWISLFLLLCAVLSKTVAASLPAALLVVIWWKSGNIKWRDVAGTLPMFVLAIPLALLTAVLEKSQIGAVGVEWDMTLIERTLIAGRAVWFYLGKLLWPYPLIFVYPRWQIDAAQWWQTTFPVGGLGLLAFLWFARHRLGRGPLAAALLFVGTLFPALGYFNVYPMRYSYVADHFQYLASLAPIALMAAGVTLLAKRHPGARQTLWPITIAVLVVLAALCCRQTRIYRNLETLWIDTIKKNPQAWMAHNNLGYFYFSRGSRGDLLQAEQCFQKTLQLKPDHARAHYNLGNVYSRQNLLQKAEEQFKLAVKYEEFAEGFNNLANALARQERYDEARENFETALRLKDDYAGAHYNFAQLHLKTGDKARAQQHFERILESQPRHALTNFELGQLMAEQDQPQRAKEYFLQALRARHQHLPTLKALAWLLATSDNQDVRDPELAVRLGEKAVELTARQDAESLNSLAAALAAGGNFGDAAQRQAAALDFASEEQQEAYRERLEHYRAKSGQR